MIYSIIASCRRHGIHPCDYLKEALEELAAATNKTVGSFTPAEWAARRLSGPSMTTGWMPIRGDAVRRTFTFHLKDVHGGCLDRCYLHKP